MKKTELTQKIYANISGFALKGKSDIVWNVPRAIEVASLMLDSVVMDYDKYNEYIATISLYIATSDDIQLVCDLYSLIIGYIDYLDAKAKEYGTDTDTLAQAFAILCKATQDAKKEEN